MPKKRRVIINVLEGKGIRTLMSLTDIKKTLEKLTVDIDAIADQQFPPAINSYPPIRKLTHV
jgi:hypothetical protein